MNRRIVRTVVAGSFVVAAAFAVAQEQKKPPSGMSEADTKACVEAATPGPQHAFLAEGAGVWTGPSTIWMAPGAEPAKSTLTSTVTPIMDGRYVRVETRCEMPGMGPHNGFGLYGFDNVSQTYESVWIESSGTGVAHAQGERSADGQSMTWTYQVNCPVTKKPTTMRVVEKRTGKDAETLEIFVLDPKSGQEYKAMQATLTRTRPVAPEKIVGSR